MICYGLSNQCSVPGRGIGILIFTTMFRAQDTGSYNLQGNVLGVWSWSLMCI